MKKVYVIGCGASGMMAAIGSSIKGNDVTIFEKNDRPGRKLLITGKGRCNVTNITAIENFFKNIPENEKFLYSAFRKLSNTDLIEFLESNGLKLKIERGGRVFPTSDRSKDVLNTFIKILENNNVAIHYNSKITDILTNNGKIIGLVVNNEKRYCDSIILATGGLSYPFTGSTGDGYVLAKKLGHTVTDLKPSLVPLVTEENVSSLMGLSLKNISVTAYSNEKVIKKEFGEFLFTHFGLSGPVILTLSRYILDYIKNGVMLKVDLKPALNIKKLDERLIRDFLKYQKKEFKNSLNDLLPQTLIPYIVSLSGIEPDKKVAEISKEERNNLVKLLKGLTFHIKATRSFNEAIITSGGISTKEINPSTMESKIIKGLFFAGEIIDVDALTGGYNLQIAFSTGYLAGLSS